ncbi:MAG: ribosome maturation factor RimM [Bacteroidia bacterium]|nr:ribosome maturation factor RimM [Bacteroidia bacterium]
MERTECVEIGYIMRAHGIQGAIRVVLDVSDITEYRRRRQLYMARPGQPLTPCTVRHFQVATPKQAILQIAESQDRNTAEGLVGTTLFFPLEKLPKLPEGRFYYHDVIGFQVVDLQLGPLGTVQDFVDGPAQDIMVMDYQGHEVLIPMTDDFVLQADMEARTIETDLPEGLIDIYLGQDEDETDEPDPA